MKDLVVMQGKQVVTSSLQIAEDFEKRHDDVLKAIEKLTRENGGVRIFFSKGEYKNARGRNYPMYYVNRDGFALLAMGFTGGKALQFKLKYIEAFNKMEEALTPALPTSYKEALIQLVESIEENEKLQTDNLVLTQQVQEFEPKASYYDTVLQSKDLVTITQIAKDYGMSGVGMNTLLHELGVQYRQGGVWLLYAKHQKQGYTQTSTHIIVGNMTKVTTKWRQKGRLFLYDLLKSKGILPVSEQEELEGGE